MTTPVESTLLDTITIRGPKRKIFPPLSLVKPIPRLPLNTPTSRYVVFGLRPFLSITCKTACAAASVIFMP